MKKTYVAAATWPGACYDRFQYKTLLGLMNQIERIYKKTIKSIGNDGDGSVHVIFTDKNWVTLV